MSPSAKWKVKNVAFGEVKSEKWKVKNQSYYAPPPFVNEELRMKSEEFATAL